MHDLLKIILSLLGGVVAGYIGAATSGGGLLSIPLLVLLGLPPTQAIATNRLGAFGLSIAAIPRYHKAGKIDWKMAGYLTPLAIVGGYIGSKLVTSINPQTLSYIVAFLLLAMLPIIITKKKLGVETISVSKKRMAVGYISFFLIMIFGGFFGGGTGPFLLYSMTAYFGMTYIVANATSFVPWLFLSATALTTFILSGVVNYPLGISLGIGMYLGGAIGTKHALKKGDGWVRVFFIVIIIASAIKLVL